MGVYRLSILREKRQDALSAESVITHYDTFSQGLQSAVGSPRNMHIYGVLRLIAAYVRTQRITRKLSICVYARDNRDGRDDVFKTPPLLFLAVTVVTAVTENQSARKGAPPKKLPDRKAGQS